MFNRVMQRAVARRLAALERVADFLFAGREAAWLRQVLREWQSWDIPDLVPSSDNEISSDPPGLSGTSSDASDDSEPSSPSAGYRALQQAIEPTPTRPWLAPPKLSEPQPPPPRMPFLLLGLDNFIRDRRHSSLSRLSSPPPQALVPQHAIEQCALADSASCAAGPRPSAGHRAHPHRPLAAPAQAARTQAASALFELPSPSSRAAT